jgi:hypothetical protein
VDVAEEVAFRSRVVLREKLKNEEKEVDVE